MEKLKDFLRSILLKLRLFALASGKKSVTVIIEIEIGTGKMKIHNIDGITFEDLKEAARRIIKGEPNG